MSQNNCTKELKIASLAENMTSATSSHPVSPGPLVEDSTSSEDQGHASDTTAISTLDDDHRPDGKDLAASSEDGEQRSVQDTTASPTSTAQSEPVSPKISSALQGQDQEDISTDKRGNPAACIFVASLAKTKTDEELNVSVSNHFTHWGVLLNVKVLKDWLRRPYAFVQFERIFDAEKALQEAPGTILDGRSIRCEPARVNRTICITPFAYPGYLPSERELTDEMSAFGAVEDVFVVRPEYCAYIKYCYRDDAIRAFLSLRAEHASSRWLVSWSANVSTVVKKPSYQIRVDTRAVFVSNLFMDVSEDDLYERFSRYGSIVNIKLIRRPVHGHSGAQRLFAFVKYETDQSAQDAIMNQHDVEWQGRRLRVSLREFREPTPDNRMLPRPPAQSATVRKGSDHPHPPGMGFPASDICPTTASIIPRPLLVHDHVTPNEGVAKEKKDELNDGGITPRSHLAATGAKKSKRRAASHPPSRSFSEEERLPIQDKMTSMHPTTAVLGSQEKMENNNPGMGALFAPSGAGGYYQYGPLPAAANAGAYSPMGYFPPQTSPQHPFGPASAYPAFGHRQIQERVAASYMNGGAYYIPPYSVYSTMPYTTGAHYPRHPHFVTGQAGPVGPKYGRDLGISKCAVADKGGRKHKTTVHS